jgi:alpha-glucosidase (family GH31 glycosyl hydrolase)
MGVDFWWIDWQQGGNTKIEGLDPLWMLNHFHYLDNKRKGKCPLILSRYAGIGSHRYPVGFSGDSFVTWEMLDFQPYFTATASNAGYGWWSHDTGGHMHGVKSDEMAARWIQFGVFSPIMRIHSSDNPFNEKEPWKYNLIVENTMKKFLRLRHQLIPYLYTMNYRFHQYGEPIIQPMYYHHPEDREAYEVPNEYYFGSELIACPITKPVNTVLTMGCMKAWLPEGIYFDFFTGRVYRGGRFIDFYRDITLIPVLAKAGTILPLTKNASVKNATDNPVDMEIRIFAGENGRFQLYEDNSLYANQENLQTVITDYQLVWNRQNKAEFTIKGYQGEEGVIPKSRNYTLMFTGFVDTDDIQITCSGEIKAYQKDYDKETQMIIISINSVDTREDVTVLLHNSGSIAGNQVLQQAFIMLNRAQIEFDRKDTIYRCLKKNTDITMLLGELQALDLGHDLFGALIEIITAY